MKYNVIPFLLYRRSIAIISVVLGIVSLVPFSTMAQTLNCEAIAELKPADSDKINPAIIENCIMNGFDPPPSWREQGGAARGIGSVSSITPVNKCSSEGVCPSNDPKHKSTDTEIIVPPKVPCATHSKVPVAITIANLAGIKCDKCKDVGVDLQFDTSCNQCVNGFIRNLPQILREKRVQIPCTGGFTQKEDASTVDCIHNDPLSLTNIDPKDPADVSAVFPCGGYINIGNQSTSLTGGGRVAGKGPDFLVRTHARTAVTPNFITIYENDGTGNYRLVQTIRFSTAVQVVLQPIANWLKAGVMDPNVVRTVSVPDAAGRPVPTNYFPPDVTFNGGLPVTLPPDSVEAINRTPTDPIDTNVLARSGNSPPRSPQATWEEIVQGTKSPTRNDCYTPVLVNSVMNRICNGTRRWHTPRDPCHSSQARNMGLKFLYWSKSKCPLTSPTKQLEIKEELIGVQSAATFFPVHFQNHQLVALFQSTGNPAAPFQYFVNVPDVDPQNNPAYQSHASGLTEPRMGILGVNIVYDPTPGDNCAFDHLSAPAPCSGYQLAVDRSHRALILPPDRKVYEGPLPPDGKLGPVLPNPPTDHTKYNDPIIFKKLDSGVAGDFIKAFIAPNQQETVALFPDNTKLEVYGPSQLMLLDGGFLILPDGTHLTIPSNGVLNFSVDPAGNLSYTASKSDGGAFLSGENSGRTPANSAYSDPIVDVTGTTYTYTPLPYNRDYERRVPPLHVDNPIYPGYPAVIRPRGAVKFLDKELLFPVAGFNQAEQPTYTEPTGDPYVLVTEPAGAVPPAAIPPSPPGFVDLALNGNITVDIDSYIFESTRLARMRICGEPRPPAACPNYDPLPPPLPLVYDNTDGAPLPPYIRAYPLPKGTSIRRDNSGMVYTSNGYQIKLSTTELARIYRKDYLPTHPVAPIAPTTPCDSRLGPPYYNPADPNSCRDGDLFSATGVPVIAQPAEPTNNNCVVNPTDPTKCVPKNCAAVDPRDPHRCAP